MRDESRERTGGKEWMEEDLEKRQDQSLMLKSEEICFKWKGVFWVGKSMSEGSLVGVGTAGLGRRTSL